MQCPYQTMQCFTFCQSISQSSQHNQVVLHTVLEVESIFTRIFIKDTLCKTIIKRFSLKQYLID